MLGELGTKEEQKNNNMGTITGTRSYVVKTRNNKKIVKELGTKFST